MSPRHAVAACDAPVVGTALWRVPGGPFVLALPLSRAGSDRRRRSKSHNPLQHPGKRAMRRLRDTRFLLRVESAGSPASWPTPGLSGDHPGHPRLFPVGECKVWMPGIPGSAGTGKPRSVAVGLRHESRCALPRVRKTPCTCHDGISRGNQHAALPLICTPAFFGAFRTPRG